MKGQHDLPAIEDHEDLLRRVPLIYGYKPRGEIIMCQVTDHVTQAWLIEDLDRLPLSVRQARESGSEEEFGLVLIASEPDVHTLQSTIDNACVLMAPGAIQGLNLSVVVDWGQNNFRTSVCRHEDPSPHPIVEAPWTIPGQTIYEDKETWERSYTDVEKIVPDYATTGRYEAILTSLRNHPEPVLTELATDLRGLDDAGALALAEYITTDTLFPVVRTWAANGWNVDNLARLARTNSSWNAQAAVALTLLSEGMVAAASIVAEKIPETSELATIRKACTTKHGLLIQFTQAWIFSGTGKHKIPDPIDVREEGEID